MFNVSNAALRASLVLLLLQGATGPPAYAGERHVLLTNNTHEPIVEIYVSDLGAGNWQADLLGADFLPPANPCSSISMFVTIGAASTSKPFSTMGPISSLAASMSAAMMATQCRCADLRGQPYGAERVRERGTRRSASWRKR